MPQFVAQPAGHHPAAHLAVGQLEVDDAIDVVALQEELGLPLVAREAVDDEAVVPVVLGEPVLHHALGEVVTDQLTGRHGAPHLRTELGVVLHVPPEDVPDGDVHKIEVAASMALCVPLPLPWTPMMTYLRMR